MRTTTEFASLLLVTLSLVIAGCSKSDRPALGQVSGPVKIMGKDVAAKGIVTVDQLPDAIARLEAAIAEDKARFASVAEEERPVSEVGARGELRPFVTLTQRAVPLLELLQWSLKKKKPMTWGV